MFHIHYLVMKSRRVRWEVHAACIGEVGSTGLFSRAQGRENKEVGHDSSVQGEDSGQVLVNTAVKLRDS